MNKEGSQDVFEVGADLKFAGDSGTGTVGLGAGQTFTIAGDPAIIGVVCSLVSDQTNGKFKLLKWDRQEKTYYPIEINIFQK